ncbi:MAG: hypothetical protein ACKV0T_21340 [Planctomycetales bacterium]
MTSRAKITVTTGPDRGKWCALSGELTRVGRGPENDLVLTDPQLPADDLASIVQRDGRFAIITMLPGGIEIDGTEVPSERWVWLPESAQIRVSRRTSLEFTMQGGAEPEGEPADAAEAPVLEAVAAPVAETAAAPRSAKPKVPTPLGEPPGSSAEVRRTKRGTGERADKKSRTVAKFITSGPGDPLVKLGEDGHLPELTLKEGLVREGREASAAQSNPALLAVALVVSVGLTLAMLLMEGGGYGDSAAEKVQARREIRLYYGAATVEPKPYQVHLRQAGQARARGDRETERSEYRLVLRQLRSEAKDKLYRYTGLTGRLDYTAADRDSVPSDRRLEELIAILLRD